MTIHVARDLKLVPIETLKPYERNARTHSEAQIDQIVASITEFGWTNPILVDGDKGIIAGHGRLAAAKKMGLREVPVIEMAHLSPTQKRALILADNQIALNSGWDNEILSEEIEALKLEEFDIDLLGFSDEELADLLPDEEKVPAGDADEVPEPAPDPKVVRGEVYLLGKHRLMCGDSTAVTDVERLMAGQPADLIFTEPPYGMSYEGGRGKKEFGMIENDDAEGEDLVRLVRDALACGVTVKKPGAAAYVCFTWRTYAQFEAAMNEVGLQPKSCIVWDKGSIGLSHAHYRPQHEFIFYSNGESWFGDRAQSDVWLFKRDSSSNYVHPTQKPVDLIERALSNSSKKGDVVLDLFGGSGSTMIACVRTGRAARLMELDPKYCHVILDRWEKFTGKKACREDGTPWSVIRAE